MQRVKRDDQVLVISGRDKGKRGKVRRVLPQAERVVVEGLNLVKKHLRKSQDNPQGAILSREAPLPLDRVMPVCPRCNLGVRVGVKAMGDGTRARICRRCGEGF